MPLDDLLSRQSKIGESRSSILNPLQWMTVILVGGLSSFVLGRADKWLVELMAVLLSVTFTIFAGAFVYFMIVEPGFLRSEDFVIMSRLIDENLFTPKMAERLINRDKAGKRTIKNASDLAGAKELA